MECLKKKEYQYLCLGIVFCLFVVVGCYKLTNAPLWLDETNEYYNSKFLIGQVSGGGATTNMYERIISTFQPPLYNLLMFVWLLINDSEWWFRVSGVVLGLLGAIGLYKTVKHMIHFKAALISVVIYTFIYQQIYYVQECAEYILMLTMLYWTFYFFVLVMEKVELKNTILFTLFCILAVYSQYGAIFPVFALASSVLVKILLQRNWKETKQILIIYFTAFVTAALPLYYFFLRLQIKNQGTLKRENITIFLEKDSLLFDFVNAIYNVFTWNMIASVGESGKYLIIIVLSLFMIIGIIILGKVPNIISKYLVVINIITWILYYIVVKLGYYGYGKFLNRYHLFFIPVWLVSFFGIHYVFLKWLFEKIKNREAVVGFIKGIISIVLLCYCLNGWISIQKNWTKEDIRGAVDAWYQAEAFNSNTFVYYGAETGFAYYLEKNSLYGEKYKENIQYQSWMKGKTKEEYFDYIQKIYQNEWPQELYLCASHIAEDLDIMIGIFIEQGYNMETLFDENNAKLIRLQKN